MNKNQKKSMLLCMGLFFFSLLYVPEELNVVVGGGGGRAAGTQFWGFTFITDLTYEISLKTLLIEWFAIAILFFALYFYNKES